MKYSLIMTNRNKKEDYIGDKIHILVSVFKVWE